MLPVSSGVSILVTSVAAPHLPHSRCNWTHAAVLVGTNILVSNVRYARSLLLMVVLVVRLREGKAPCPHNLKRSRSYLLLPDGCSGTARNLADQQTVANKLFQIRQVSIFLSIAWRNPTFSCHSASLWCCLAQVQYPQQPQ